MVLMARLSLLPSHCTYSIHMSALKGIKLTSAVTTVIFALAGTNFFKFLAALLVSLIQPFAYVYVGEAVLEAQRAYVTTTRRVEADELQIERKDSSNIASDVTLVASIVISLGAMFYINRKANKAKPGFVTERRMARRVSKSLSCTVV